MDTMNNKQLDINQEVLLDKKTDLELDLLLNTIYQLSSFDFRQYARSSIYRRIHNRMKMDQIPTISRLLEKVIHEEGVLEKLLNDFSINVTEMFRDPSFFQAFRTKVVPILREYPEIRIWHAGCATGEEVFSMAILLKEEGLLDKTILYATDMNEEVLKKAKQGAFSLLKMKNYTKNYLQAGGTHAFSEYYQTDHLYAYFHSDLLKNIIFAQHNLVTDQSFNEFHVIICRNVLIYFTTELQNQVQQLFFESLGEKGFLGLGDKETLCFTKTMAAYTEFVPKEKIYQKN